MTRLPLLVIALIALGTSALAAPKPGDTLACASKDPSKRLYVVVGVVEPFGTDRTVASITLIDETPGSPIPGVAHLPVEAAVLEASCPKRAETARALAPEFESGRQQWLEAVRTQHAGVFTVSIDEIDDMIRQQMARPRP